MTWTDTIVDLFHSNDVDLAAFKAAGGEAVILKASQGTGFTDPKFAERSKEAAELGLMVAAYHFCTGSDPQQQVDHFLAIAKGIAVLAIDVEPNPNGSTVTVAQAAEIAILIEHATGRKPLIYIGRYGPDGEGGGLPNATLAACPLWLSEYQVTTPRLPAGWDACMLWQWTDTGSFPGVAGDCDRDRFNGTSAELKAFWGATAPMTGTTDVLTALRGSGLLVEAQAFLAAIAEGEGGTTFRVLFSGGTLLEDNPNVVTVKGRRSWTGELGEFPNWAGARLANGLISTAAGAFQDTKTTWNSEIVHLAGTKTDFSPETQIANNWIFAQSRFKSRSSGHDLLDTLQHGSTDDVTMYLGKTWTGGADSGFTKRYAANLVALKEPMPSEITVSLASPIKLSGVDEKGKPVSLIIRLACAAALAVAVPYTLLNAPVPPAPLLPSIVRVAEVPPITSPDVFDDSTFCFGPGLQVIRDLEQCRSMARTVAEEQPAIAPQPPAEIAPPAPPQRAASGKTRTRF